MSPSICGGGRYGKFLAAHRISSSCGLYIPWFFLLSRAFLTAKKTKRKTITRKSTIPITIAAILPGSNESSGVDSVEIIAEFDGDTEASRSVSTKSRKFWFKLLAKFENVFDRDWTLLPFEVGDWVMVGNWYKLDLPPPLAAPEYGRH